MTYRILTISFFMLCVSAGLAQDLPTSEQLVGGLPSPATGQTARYIVPFVKSEINILTRTATAVTIVNNSTTACTVTVEWFSAFADNADRICTSSRSLLPGRTVTLCNHSIPGAPISCFDTCGSGFFFEGFARVTSTAGTACSKIAVDPAAYLINFQDFTVAAIRSLKVVKAGAGNNGD